MSESNPGNDRRSTFDHGIAGEIFDASASAGRALQVGLAQYQTPPDWASWFHTLLPQRPETVFDPQCAAGALLVRSQASSYAMFGWDLDPKFTGEYASRQRHHVTGNCVQLWELLDELFPEVRFGCQVANPPFSIPWRLPDGSSVDSTLHTWNRIQSRSSADGFGFLLANADTIERLRLHESPVAYLYQRFPVGMFPEARVEIGVIHWWRRRAPTGVAAPEAPRLELRYASLNRLEHAAALGMLREELKRLGAPVGQGSKPTDFIRLGEVWTQLRQILEEEREERPPYHIHLRNGRLNCWLSTRLCLRQKLSSLTVQRILRLSGSHPMALAPEADTRRILREVIEAGIYTIQPEAESAIRDALLQVERMAVPIMPVTGFEAVAYADEMDELECRGDFTASDPKLQFAPGQRYALSSGCYRFTEHFSRTKLEYREEDDTTETVRHNFSLSGTDRYVSVQDEAGVVHRFMDRPSAKPAGNWLEHPERLLWEIFVQPTITTVAEALPEQVAACHRRLLEIQSTIKG